MSQPTSPAPKKPGRSPVEAAIVWGFILIGTVLAGVEAKAWFGHSAALAKLQKQIESNSETNVGVTKKDVDKVVGSKAPERQKLKSLDTAMSADCVDIYNYSGLLKSRKIYVYYGVAGKEVEGKPQEAEVLRVQDTEAEKADVVFAKLKTDPNSAPAPTVAMPNMNMVGGRGGAGPGSAPAAGGRPATEEGDDKKPAGDAKPEVIADDKKPAEETKPADEKKPEGDAKPAETEKPAEEAKPAEADKPAADKPAEAEPKKE